MAKAIKAIQCPKCGSTEKTELKPDHFRCNSCNTEYFLDNDDININHNINYNQPANRFPSPDQDRTRKIAGIIGIGAIVMIFFMFRIFSFSGSSSKALVTKNTPDDFSWWHSDVSFYTGSNQQPVLVIAGTRSYNGSSHESKEGAYISFYDALSHKELGSQRISGINTAAGNDFKVQTFKNNDVYIIIDKSTILKVNKSGYHTENLTRSGFAGQPQLVSGIANAEFIYNGDGFNLLTNEGKNVYYFPVIDKVYTKEEMQQAIRDLSTVSPADKTVIAYSFSNTSSDYPDEKRQLIRYVKKDNKGGPNDYPRFEWTKQQDFRTNTVKKVLPHWGADLVISYSDLTPGRLYFEPKILYSDDDYVLISCNNTPAEKSPTAVRCLDGHTGAIIFTTPFTENKYFYNALRFKSGFMIKSNNSVPVIGMDGNMITEYKL